jgi:MoxR-like ATPase
MAVVSQDCWPQLPYADRVDHDVASKCDLAEDAAAVGAAVKRAQVGLVDREVLTELVALSAVAGEHLLVIGPPGTAKSLAVRRVAEELGGNYFEYLLGRFTEPNEVFGPVNLQRLREGLVEIETGGMLPEAEIAFLDEVFLGSTAILNTLLGLLNERVFRRGSTVIQSPLRVCVGAANRLPDDPALDAFADRFLTRVFIDSVPDSRLEEMLEAGWNSEFRHLPVHSAMPSVIRLAEAARRVEMGPVAAHLGLAVRRLRSAGLVLSDRRIVRTQRLIAAAAVLDGRDHAESADLWVLPLTALTADAQVVTREVLTDILAAAKNQNAVHSAEEFSRGHQARSQRLVVQADQLVSELGANPTRDDTLRLEATLREIDATFAPESIDEELATRRARLVDTVKAANADERESPDASSAD